MSVPREPEFELLPIGIAPEKTKTPKIAAAINTIKIISWKFPFIVI
jgi:hypothetical protein